MPRANRHFLPGHAWHITHRCHKKDFLLKFSKDRARWRHWLFQAKKRYGLCVLNYIVTSNHIHLLVVDRGLGEISKSMQLIAGRTAQEYNQRKNRKGAFWDDRYHATAVDTDEYLAHCMAYIDMNMVRAGVVPAPGKWRWSGYHELQISPRRYTVIDIGKLLELSGIAHLERYQQVRKEWIEEALKSKKLQRISSWTNSLAIGSQNYVERVKSEMCLDGKSRSVSGISENGIHALKEPAKHYTTCFPLEKEHLSDENMFSWDE